MAEQKTIKYDVWGLDVCVNKLKVKVVDRK